jgi:hypothetical protein
MISRFSQLPMPLAVAALALTGCGGSGGSKKQADGGVRGYTGPVTAVQAYADAFGSGDYATACSYIDKASLAKVTQKGKLKCEEVYAKGGAAIAAARKQFAGAKASDASVDADHGTVKLTTSSGSTIGLPVVLEDGTWKVSSGTLGK